MSLEIIPSPISPVAPPPTGAPRASAPEIIDSLDARIDRIDSRLERLEGKFDKFLESQHENAPKGAFSLATKTGKATWGGIASILFLAILNAIQSLSHN